MPVCPHCDALAHQVRFTRDGTGFEVTYGNTRYLPREVFVALVRRGFAGTTKAGSEAVLEVAAQQAQTREVVLASQTRRSDYDHPNRADRVMEPIF
ncbi:hypothetical protein OG777_31075 [Micromonospora peucetia]|uniref:hypothetical protein n=1 Tax=Micromonospora peucetia TaxID=47871 RepID=UPI002257BFDE|nr:hypothetical protein [Micromonospora peucetia]MCX4391349.1 hypothetical protein [Micromonospora peucetia]